MSVEGPSAVLKKHIIDFTAPDTQRDLAGQASFELCRRLQFGFMSSVF
jgi:hypothetical protein